MFKVVRYTIVIILLVLINACSVLRQSKAGNSDLLPGTKWEKASEFVVDRNISNSDFTISRFKLYIENKSLENSASGFLRVRKDGQILISIRSIAGLEVARGLISSDSIKVYDKINEILYVQSLDYIFRKYGLGNEYLPLLWGDLPLSIAEKRFSVLSATSNCYKFSDNNRKMQICVDSKSSKLLSFEGVNSNYQNLNVAYSNVQYDESNNSFPENIKFSLPDNSLYIELTLRGFKSEKIRNMKFSPGRIKEIISIK